MQPALAETGEPGEIAIGDHAEALGQLLAADLAEVRRFSPSRQTVLVSVRFRRVPDRELRAELAALGVALAYETAPNLWLADATPEGAVAALRLTAVQGVGPESIKDKASREVFAEFAGHNNLPGAEEGAYRRTAMADGRLPYFTLFEEDTDFADLAALQAAIRVGADQAYYELKRSDGFVREQPGEFLSAFAEAMLLPSETFTAGFEATKSAIVLADPVTDLPILLRFPKTRWVEFPPGAIEIQNENSRKLSSVDAAKATGLSGEGVAVGVWEADEDPHTRAVADSYVLTGHMDFLAAPLTPDAPAGGPAYSNHATHVAGTIAGTGASVSAAAGMAPKARIISYNATNDFGECKGAAGGPCKPHERFRLVIDENGEIALAVRGHMLTLSNHSYAYDHGYWVDDDGDWALDPAVEFDGFGRYTGQSKALDSIARGFGNTMVFAAGNDRRDGKNQEERDCAFAGGVDRDCLGEYAVAKNVVTVGALAYDTLNPAGVHLACYSNVGPTNDGRIKPDFVAHGGDYGGYPCAVTGRLQVRSPVATGPGAVGWLAGTSMAAPAVTGVLALLQEQASKSGVAVFDAAAAKAVLAQTADDVVSASSSGPEIVLAAPRPEEYAHQGPDYMTGWGVPNAERAIVLLDCAQLSGAASCAGGTGLYQGEVSEDRPTAEIGFEVTPPTGPAQPFKVTLAWIDYPGDPAFDETQTASPRPQLINDLDLRLIDPNGVEHMPWLLDPEDPGRAAARGDDKLNTIEQVFIASELAAPGKWTARVAYENTGSAESRRDSQPFALAGLFRNIDVKDPNAPRPGRPVSPPPAETPFTDSRMPETCPWPKDVRKGDLTPRRNRRFTEFGFAEAWMDAMKREAFDFDKAVVRFDYVQGAAGAPLVSQAFCHYRTRSRDADDNKPLILTLRSREVVNIADTAVSLKFTTEPSFRRKDDPALYAFVCTEAPDRCAF